MIVREAKPGEMAAVGELRVTAYTAGNMLAVNSPYASTLRALGADGRGEVLVAVDDGEVLGTVMFDPWHPASEVARAGDEAEVRALAVAPAAQRRGVGAALVGAVIDLAARRGVHRLMLSTQPSMTTAQRLYAAAGFTRVPDRDWEPMPGFTLLAFGRPIAA